VAEANSVKSAAEDEFDDDIVEILELDRDCRIASAAAEEVRRAFTDLGDACGWRGTGSKIAHGAAWQRLADALTQLRGSLESLVAECWHLAFGKKSHSRVTPGNGP